MAWSNFTPPSDNDDDDMGSGGNFGGMPAMFAPPSQSVDDVTELLINYNDRFKQAAPAMFREQLIDMTMAILISKNKPNVILEGSAGVGKTKIAEEIARMIANNDASVPKKLQKTQIWELPLSNIVAGGGIVGEIESRISKLIEWTTDPKNDCVIFIDEIHLLYSNSETYRKIAQILKPALARGDMRVIGATTNQEARSLDEDPAFARRFSKIVVDELTREQTAQVITDAALSYSTHFNNQIYFDNQLAHRLVLIADENSSEAAKRPDNALTLLDRTMADMIISHSRATNNAKAAKDTNMVQVLHSMLPLRVSEAKLKAMAVRLISGLAKQKPFDEAELRQQLSAIRGQEDAIEQVTQALVRRNLGAFSKTTPTVVMFAGPSGVGKTQAAKIMAEALTGQQPMMLNMAEYSSQWDESKLIGSPPGYIGSDSNRELPFDTLKSNPHRLILLDEMEKAHHSIHSLFLSAFDQGWIRAAGGNVIDFSKAIFVITTNAGAEALSNKPALGFQADTTIKSLNREQITKALKSSFTPEFLGRIEQLIGFAPISRDTYREIFLDQYRYHREQMLISDPSRAQLITWPLDDDTIEEIVSKTYVPALGARPALRAAIATIEDALVAALNPTLTSVAAVATDEEL